MRLARALFVLPTLFTLTGVFLGFLSLVSAADGRFALSAISIVFAFVFDSIDGRVARMTRTQSQFGIQIDSLADVMTFGLAPAVLTYLFFFQQMTVGRVLDIGMVLPFVFLAAGAIRLARYNVDAGRKGNKPMRLFVGLPIPGAAGIVAGLVFGLSKEATSVSPVLVGSMMVVLSVLMLSPVRYRKTISFRDPLTRILFGTLGLTLLIVAVTRPVFVPFAFFSFYVLEGLIEGIARRLLATSRRARMRRKSDRIS